MTTLSDRLTPADWPLPLAAGLPAFWDLLVYQRLNEVFHHALPLPFDNASRLVFISDVHRGDNSPTDEFAPNKPLFLHTLKNYYELGFTYIEVGDGDDAWKYRSFARIKQAHALVFTWLHRFARDNRLFIVVGNHDYEGSSSQAVIKDGLPTYEGLRLRHRHTGRELFVTHGHQADFACDRFAVFSRLLVRHFWRRWQRLGFGLPSVEKDAYRRRSRATARIERRIMGWVAHRRQLIICGHTHRPASPSPHQLPYFNSGSCVHPGFLTALELSDGELRLVRWETDSLTSPTPAVRRLAISPPRSLHAFATT